MIIGLNECPLVAYAEGWLCQFVLVDLESEGLRATGGGTIQYLKTVEVLSRRYEVCLVTRESMMNNLIRLSLRNVLFLSYNPKIILNPKCYFDGYALGGKMPAKGVIATSPFFNTFFFSLGLANSSKAPMILFMHHHPRLVARIKKMGLMGLASYAFYLPAIYSRYLPYVFQLYTSTGETKGTRIYNDIWVVTDRKACGHNSAMRDIDICYVGRLSKMKGFDEFVTICEKLRNKIPNLRVAVIGRKFQIDPPVWMEYLGTADDETKYYILGHCKLFLFPSHEEGFSIATWEAMCNGAVPVIWDLPGYPFKSVVRVPEWNVDAMAKIAEQLLLNDEIRNKISENAMNESLTYANYDGLINEIKRILSIVRI
jgi:glycosyltransferase involved in cell wall biosynthesis